MVRRLVEIGARVAVVDDFSYAPRSNVPKEVELVTADACDLPRIAGRKAFRDIDFLIHLASPSSVILFDRSPQRCFTATVSSLIGVFEFAKSNGVKKVVFPSSGSVYGDTPPPQSEADTPRPGNLYAVAKVACEGIADMNADKVPSVGLRIFAGFGPGEEHKHEYASPVTIFLQSLVRRQAPLVFGDGTQTRDFVYVDDVVEAILGGFGIRHRGVINVGSGVSCSFNEAIKTLNEALGQSVAPAYVSRPARYLEHTRAETSLMRSVLGIEPTGFEAAVTKYLDYMKAPEEYWTSRK